MEQLTNRLLELNKLIEESEIKTNELNHKLYGLKEESEKKKAEILLNHLKQFDIELDLIRYGSYGIDFFLSEENNSEKFNKVCTIYQDREYNKITLSYYSTSYDSNDEYKRLIFLGKFGHLFYHNRQELTSFLNYLYEKDYGLNSVVELYHNELYILNKLRDKKKSLTVDLINTKIRLHGGLEFKDMIPLNNNIRTKTIRIVGETSKKYRVKTDTEEVLIIKEVLNNFIDSIGSLINKNPELIVNLEGTQN